MEEGTDCEMPGDEIGLVVGEPAQFRYFSSAVRKDDRPGTLVSSWSDDELTETDPLTATLPATVEAGEGHVPVRFHSKITELGMFDATARPATSAGSWNSACGTRGRERTAKGGRAKAIAKC